MWNMTTDSFTSAVFKNGKFQVRARDLESLTALGYAEDRVLTGLGTDYPYRVYSTHEEYAELMYKAILAIDYSNFKNQAKIDKGDAYAKALAGTWWDMMALEPKDSINLLAQSSFRLPKKKGTKYKPAISTGKAPAPLLELGGLAETHWGYDDDDIFDYDRTVLDDVDAIHIMSDWDREHLEGTTDPILDDANWSVDDEGHPMYKGTSIHGMSDAEWLAFCESESAAPRDDVI